MDVILIRYQDIDLLRGWQNYTKFFLTKSYVMPEQICLCVCGGGGGNLKTWCHWVICWPPSLNMQYLTKSIIPRI